jgi:hypothetical protein
MEVVVGEVRPIAQKEHMEMPTEQDPLRKSNTQNDGIDHASLCVALRCVACGCQSHGKQYHERIVRERGGA